MSFASVTVDLSASELREAQRGSLHAVAAHRTYSDAPAQVVLPTGVGKTLVATLLPYVLDATRVLVVAPARIIRDQLAHSFDRLELAKGLGAMPQATRAPNVYRADHRCTSDVWDACRDMDVVVGTPQVLSHSYEGVDEIPEGLFDLVIFDEAHHLPAPTWTTLHAHLSSVPTVLLTATPFRADRRRLPGEIAFAYPLRRAIGQGAYKPVRFVPVAPVAPGARDAALAEKVVQRLREPAHAAAGSRVLVRTDRKAHATQLLETYGDAGLQMALVLDRTSGRTVRRLLEKLEGPDLQGLVVVGAMTEGFDYPRMKLAVYHRPHKTLAPTLQFVGRLARAGDVQGELIAFAEDVSAETSELFREDAAWETLLPNIIDAAVDRERRVRQFTGALSTRDPGNHRVSALALAPPRSTHIYRLASVPNFSFDPAVLARGDVIERFRHDQDQLVAYITRHRLHPRFLREDVLDSVEHQLHVATWVADPGLLFISTDMPSALRGLRMGLAGGAASPIDAPDLTRLLAAADLQRCFSVGARPTSIGTAANESYRTLAGPRAELSLSPSDARARVLGHVMGRKGGTGAGSGTFGFSSGKAKLWEPTATDSLAGFRDWCLSHAVILNAAQAPLATTTALNYLGLPDRLQAYPAEPSIAILPAEILSDPRELRIEGQRADPLATEVTVTQQSSATVRVTLTHDAQTCALDLDTDGHASPVGGSGTLLDPATGEIENLEDILDEHPMTLMFGDGAWVQGRQVVRPPTTVQPLPADARIPVDWTGIQVSREFASQPTPTSCVAGKTLDLLASSADWAIQDHLRGELADFVFARSQGNRVVVDLVHLKATRGAQPGTRPTDIQELLAQAMRSMYLATAGPSIWKELERRIEHRNPTKVVKGTAAAVRQQLRTWAADRPLIDWRITVVQPGVSDGQLDTWSAGNALFLAAYDTCKAQGVAFRLIDGTP